MTAQLFQPIDASTHPLETLYAFHNRTDIVLFLNEKPELVPFLEAAHTAIGTYFGDAKPTIQFVPDYEEPNLDSFVVWIRADDKDHAKYLRFEDEWQDAADRDFGKETWHVSFGVLPLKTSEL